MNNQEIQLILMNITLVLAAILTLLFIIRGIRILATKKIYTKDDAFFVLFFGLLVAIGMYYFYKIKKRIKKSKQPVV
jgi:amino acid permease